MRRKLKEKLLAWLLKDITRFTLVDYDYLPVARVYEKTGIRLEPAIQDRGRTLKFFVDERS